MTARFDGRIRKDGKIKVAFNYPLSGRTIRKIMTYEEAVKAIEEHNNKPQPTAKEIARAANPFSS